MAREHYLQQLQQLQDDMLRMASMVELAIERAIEGLKKQDVELAQLVIKDDDTIDACQHEIENKALALIATQQPLAGDLRAISVAISIAGELERMGDYAEGIAKITIRGANEPLLSLPIDLPRIAEFVQQMLHQSLDAFLRRDVEAARKLSEADTIVDDLTDQVQNELLNQMTQNPALIRRAINLLYMVHNLERIADRATNIGERVVFMVTGQVVDLNIDPKSSGTSV